MPADSGMTAGVITGDLLICKCMMVRVGLLVKAGYWGQGTPNMVVAPGQDCVYTCVVWDQATTSHVVRA